jgi:hypothetical protein
VANPIPCSLIDAHFSPRAAISLARSPRAFQWLH